jgi:nicotinamidase-related amidase
MGKKAVVLVGFQNDYFATEGILNSVVEESINVLNIVSNTQKLISSCIGSDEFIVISTPINFTKDYSELKDPVGILKTIKEVGAFQKGNIGAEVIEEIKLFGDDIIEITGKKGLNAFVGTELEQVLNENNVDEIYLAGCVCSICIDSTGRSASERGYKVNMIGDCITGRTMFEHSYYIENVFPLYSIIVNSSELVKSLEA